MPRTILARNQRPSGLPRRRVHRPVVEWVEPRVLLASFVVQSVADDNSAGTLRWAILQANSVSGPNTIQFAIPAAGVQTISLASPLPEITAAVTIDGASQPGYAGSPMIQLDGSRLTAGSDGLVLTGGDSTIQGLVISGFPGAAIVLSGGGANRVLANELGTDAGGTTALANQQGIRILGSSLNTIGGSTAGMGNLISGNRASGIEIIDSSQPATGNLIEGNLIGTTADGITALPNQGPGILVNGSGGNQIGGSNAGSGNVISGNNGSGIQLTSGASGNLVSGNFVGTAADGVTIVSNRLDGIVLDGAPSNIIGGSDPGSGNIIAGNLGNGITTLRSAEANLIGCNFIGTDVTGTLRLGNKGNGVALGSSGNTVGGVGSVGGNTIAYNGTGAVGAGVQLVGLVNRDTILSNSIYENAGLGINLGNGPTPNHAPGSGPGPNDYQNYPILSNPVSDGRSTTLTGTLLGRPTSTYTVQLFWSPLGDPSGYGEGRHELSTFDVSTDVSGKATFSPLLPVTPPGAVVSATATDGAGNTSEFSPYVQIAGVTDLDVSITATPERVGSGGSLSYQVMVRNTGSSAAHNVVVTDNLPANVIVQSVTSSQGNPPMVMGRTVISALGTIAANASATLSIVVTVRGGPGTSLINTASVVLDETDPTPGNNTASLTTPVVGLADLSVDISSSAASVSHGDSITYVATARNLGPSQATHVTISLPVVGGLSVTSVTTSQGDGSFHGGQVTADLGTLEAGDSATLTVVVRANAPGQVVSTASISGDQIDPDSSNDSASVTVTVLPVVDVGIAIAATPSPVAFGQALVYTITATNQGPDAASAVTISDLLPTGVTFVSAVSSTGAEPTLTDRRLVAILGDLPAGESATVQIHVVTSSPPGSTLLNTADVTTSERDSNPDDNRASLAIPVRDVSDLAVTMTPSASSVPAGQTVSYTVVVANLGPTDEPAAVVSIPVPPAVDVLSCSSSQGAPVLSPGLVLVELGAIAHGDHASVTLDVAPGAAAVGLLTIRASAEGYNANLAPEQAQSSATVTVVRSADVSVAVAPQPSPAYQSQDAYYTITLRNAGPSSADSVSVTSPLPPGAEFVSATASQGTSPVVQNGQISAIVGSLDAGNSATVTVHVRSASPVASGLPLSAAVLSDTFDPAADNNEAAAAMPVLSSGDLDISLVPSAGDAVVGRDFRFNVTVHNAGPSPTADAAFTFPLIAGAQFVSTTPGSLQTTIQNGALLVRLGDLGVGEVSTVGLTIRPGGTGLTRWAVSAHSGTNDLDPSNNQAAVQVNVAGSPGVIQFASPSQTVNDTGGVAAIPVLRTVGTTGTVTVHYQTSGGDAVPGLDYVPISGTLTFLDGQASQTIFVPILNNVHGNHDVYVGIALDSPTRGAVIGPQAWLGLRIHETEPDYTPPTVASVEWNGWAGGITSILVSFSEPLQAASAVNPAAYSLADLGTSGRANPSAQAIQAIGFSPPVYDPATSSVLLVPTVPLTSGHFYRLDIIGAGAAAPRDLAGNPLAGAGAGMAGTNFVTLIGQGSTLKYYDASGDLVTLRATGGGYLGLTRAESGEGLVLSLQGGIPRRSVISGTVARTRGRSGMTTLQAIEGLGRFGEVRVRLGTPPFQVRSYPFFLRTGRPLVPQRRNPPVPAPQVRALRPPLRPLQARPMVRFPGHRIRAV